MTCHHSGRRIGLCQGCGRFIFEMTKPAAAGPREPPRWLNAAQVVSASVVAVWAAWQVSHELFWRPYPWSPEPITERAVFTMAALAVLLGFGAWRQLSLWGWTVLFLLAFLLEPHVNHILVVLTPGLPPSWPGGPRLALWRLEDAAVVLALIAVGFAATRAVERWGRERRRLSNPGASA